MEWESPAIVLDVRPINDADALVTLLTQAGPHRGLARGGLSRRHAALYLQGNLIQARWVARLPDQLGTITAELVHPAAALAMDSRLHLAILAAACATAEGALPEREPHPITFGGLAALATDLPSDPAPLETLVRWEAALLAELGYGLDLATCALTGTTKNLRYVSPKTGRAVSAEAAAPWTHRLLPMPSFLVDTPGTPAAWRDGLRLTGHFLARDAFGHRHRPLPAARTLLYDLVATLAANEEKKPSPSGRGLGEGS